MWAVKDCDVLVASFGIEKCSLLHSSFCSLRDGRWLDDSVSSSDIMNSCCKYAKTFILLQVMNYVLKLSSEKRPDVFILNSFVCTAILNLSPAASRQSLRKVRYTESSPNFHGFCVVCIEHK